MSNLLPNSRLVMGGQDNPGPEVERQMLVLRLGALRNDFLKVTALPSYTRAQNPGLLAPCCSILRATATFTATYSVSALSFCESPQSSTALQRDQDSADKF